MKPDQEFSPIESANNSFKHSSRHRFLMAAALAILGLTLLVIWGPNAEQINKKFAFIGAPGEIQLVNAISVIDGEDKVKQLPKSLQKPPPPAVLEEEEEVVHKDGIREIQKPDKEYAVEKPVVPEISTDVAEEYTRNLVSMITPMQTSKNYYFKHMVDLDYPLDATMEERQTEVIFVSVQFFVEADGTISASMIQDTNGGKAFTEEVLTKLNQWIIGFYVDPGRGMWIQTTFNFKGPYFNRKLSQ